MNPDILDATGALRCVEGAAAYTLGARDQMNKLAARTKIGLRADASVVGQIKKFESAINATLSKIQLVVEEHVIHVQAQAKLANDPELHHAAVGYLDALKRGGVGGHTLASPAGAAASTGREGWTVNADAVRGPRQAEEAIRNCANALGVGMAQTLTNFRVRLLILGVESDSRSPIMLAQVNGELAALCKVGNEIASEFRRQIAVIRSLPKSVRNTQYCAWADPKNMH
jgi:hypothetical protein